LVVVGVAGGIFLRIYNLSFPGKQVFDEVYFPVFAQNYLTGTYFYDVHPPVGKFVIVVGIWLLGNDPVGWRSMPLVFGIGLIGLLARLWWVYFREKVGMALIALFVAVEGVFIVYSRTGLMDIILLFFTF